MHGWIILDKPSNITSAHAVAKVKRLLLSSPSPLVGEGGERGNSQHGSTLREPPHPNPPPRGGRELKIGHAGTLDPLASGVLPLALGEATKTVGYMMDARKAYGFTVTWGEERDTDDSQGQVVAQSENRPLIKEIQDIIPEFLGVIQQMPPSYSAIKVAGKRAYDLARSGEEVELKAREVRVDSLSIIPSPLEGEGRVGGNSPHMSTLREPPLPNPQGGREYISFICHCGKGTYIRSLARDMGRKLGCYGHVTQLRRLRVGNFDENHAISLEVLAEMVHKGDLSFLRPVESALDDIPACDVSHDQAVRLRQGQMIPLPEISAEMAEGSQLQLRFGEHLLAIGSISSDSVKPVRVFNLVNGE